MPGYAETMGWRIPFDHLTRNLWPEYQAQDHRAPVLKDHPAKSAFFEPGDRLLDAAQLIRPFLSLFDSGEISEIDPFAKPEEETNKFPEHLRCDWIVWNERSEMLVAGGGPIQLLLLEKALDLESLPSCVKITACLTTEDGETQTLSVLGRSGERFSTATETFKLEVAPNLAYDWSLIDTQFAVDYHRPNGEVVSANSSTTFQPDEAVPLASWKEGERTWGVTMSAVGLTTYGVPFHEIQWTEVEGRLVTYHSHSKEVRKQAVAHGKIGDLFVRWFRVPPDFILRISDLGDDSADPFDPGTLPSPWQGRFGTGLIDCRQALRMNGVSFAHPDSMAFHSAAGSWLIVVNDLTNLDLVEMIVGHGGCGHVSNVFIHAEWPHGSAMLATRSGEKASITSTIRDKSEALFEVAPNLGAREILVDLMYYLKPRSKEFSLSSAVTLRHNQETEVGRYTLEEAEHPVTIRAVVPGHDH